MLIKSLVLFHATSACVATLHHCAFVGNLKTFGAENHSNIHLQLVTSGSRLLLWGKEKAFSKCHTRLRDLLLSSSHTPDIYAGNRCSRSLTVCWLQPEVERFILYVHLSAFTTRHRK